MVRALPPLNALKAFEAAARHESFTLAAEELNVAHAAVSRHIRTLEARLRVALFERTGRGVLLTDEGRALAASVTSAFDLIAGATRRYAEKPRRRRRLATTADVSFATHWLAPRIGRFLRQHGDVELSIDPSHRLVDLAKEPFDFGIRFGAGKWKNVDTELLSEAEFFVVCHPSLLGGKPAPRPENLVPRC